MPTNNVFPLNVRRDSERLLAEAEGLQGQPWRRQIVALAQAAPTAGTAFGVLVPLFNGQVVTGIAATVVTAGVAAVPTSITLGLLDKTGKVLAVTAEDKNDAGWVTANAVVSVPLSPGAYTIPRDDAYYLAFLQVGAWGTTAMQLGRGINNTATLYAPVGSGVGGAASLGTSLTAFAALGATMTPTNSGVGFWLAAY